MKSKKVMKKSSSVGSNFLIDCGPPARVRCIKCKGWCESIALSLFTMYFCTNHLCTNVLELRQEKDGSWAVHDYGTAVDEPELMDVMADLVVPPPELKPVFPRLTIVK